MSHYARYNRTPLPSQRPHSQRGGSDWQNSANSVYIQPGELTRATLKHIDDSPMFHPLEPGHQIATPFATGIYPVGIYYMNQVAQKQCAKMSQCAQPGVIQRSLSSPPSGRDKLVSELKKAMS